jgi:hypothetical protein
MLDAPLSRGMTTMIPSFLLLSPAQAGDPEKIYARKSGVPRIIRHFCNFSLDADHCHPYGGIHPHSLKGRSRGETEREWGAAPARIGSQPCSRETLDDSLRAHYGA